MKPMNMFLDKDGTFSWRKAGTALCFFLFAYAVIYFLHAHNGAELPYTYSGMLLLVLTYYFAKDRLRDSNFLNFFNKKSEQSK